MDLSLSPALEAFRDECRATFAATGFAAFAARIADLLAGAEPDSQTALRICLACEEAGRAGFGTRAVATAAAAMATPAGARAPMLASLRRGASIGLALQDDAGGFSPAACTMPLERKADGLNLSGRRSFVAGLDGAEWLLMAVRRPAGDSALLPLPAGEASLRAEPLESAERQPLHRLIIDTLALRETQLTGGNAAVERLLDIAAATAAASLCGIAGAAVEAAAAHARHRQIFGRPLAAFQSTRHGFADAALWIDGAELLTRQAFWSLPRPEFGRLAAQAKAFASDRLPEACRLALHQFGGAGFLRDHPAQAAHGAALTASLLFGTIAEHRRRLARVILAAGHPPRVEAPLSPPDNPRAQVPAPEPH